MNRSILIVICDFIITSMIYLNGGFSAMESNFRDGGGATIDHATVQSVLTELTRQRDMLDAERRRLMGDKAARQDRLDEVTEQLARTRARIEFIERRARLTRENAGPLTAGEVQKELEEQIGRTTLVQTRYEQLEAELKRYREALEKGDSSFAALQSQHTSLLRELESRRQELEHRRTELENRTRDLEARNQALDALRAQFSTSQQELAALTERLASREAELARRENDLTATRSALTGAKNSSDDYRRRLGTAESELAFLQGRSSAMEKELAASRDRLEALQKVVKTRDIELTSAKTRLENMERVLKNAVTDLSRTRDELSSTRDELSSESKLRQTAQTQLTQLRGDLNTVNAQLQNAEAKLRSDVLTRYTASTLRLRRSIREKRLLTDRNDTGELYLPAIKIGSRCYLISALRTIAGVQNNASNFGDITALNYQITVPEHAEQPGPSRLPGPILVEKSDCRVALLEVPANLVQPLPILTRDELKKRGIQELYLFKAASFGKDSTILDSRCSMSFESDDDYLYIRNGARVSSELKAEPGDFVLTKQGELVAVVVAQEEYDFGRQVEARCFTFGRLPDPAALPMIELNRLPGQNVYRDFSDKVNFWLEQAKPLDARKRRR